MKRLLALALFGALLASCGMTPALALPFVNGSSTAASSTVTTGATFQSVLAANANRAGCVIQNPTTATEPLYVYFGPIASATTGASVSLAPGASVNCNAGPVILGDQVSVTAPTTGHAFTVFSQ